MNPVTLRLPDEVSQRLKRLADLTRAQQDLLHDRGHPGALGRS